MKRPFYMHQIQNTLKRSPIIGLLGPRQCGKTTLAKMHIKNLPKNKAVTYFDLEDPGDLGALKNPKATLSDIKGLIVIDEIQRRPDLFPFLRVLADRPKKPARFLILGSASRDLIRQSSETLAGRISYIELKPFSYGEAQNLKKLWLRGGFPLSYLSKTNKNSLEWRKDYISTFLERDIPNLGFQIPATTLRRFWMMLAHYHGQIFNASEISRSLKANNVSISRYLDILTYTFMVRQLQPWIENIKKRQVKSPKIYFRDNGLLHSLLGISNHRMLLSHPKLGSSWEGFALEEIIRAHQADPEDCYFWATHNQAELDLMIFSQGKRLGFEIKYSDAPRITKSMKIAMDDLKLHNLTVIYPGDKNYRLDKKIQVCGLENYLSQY